MYNRYIIEMLGGSKRSFLDILFSLTMGNHFIIILDLSKLLFLFGRMITKHLYRFVLLCIWVQNLTWTFKTFIWILSDTLT